MKYDYLTVTGKSHQNSENRWIYKCICECGNVAYRAMNQLKNKSVSSCGCKRGEARKTHGMRYTKVYKIWLGMKDRCTNKKNKDYSKYSKTGLCEQWLKFELFLLDMGEPPTDYHSIDRIDNESGYSKENCKWSTSSEQQRNKSSSKVWIVDGVEYESLVDVAKIFNTSKPVVHRWFKGYVSRGKNYPPKSGFTFKEVYK